MPQATFNSAATTSQATGTSMTLAIAASDAGGSLCLLEVVSRSTAEAFSTPTMPGGASMVQLTPAPNPGRGQHTDTLWGYYGTWSAGNITMGFSQSVVHAAAATIYDKPDPTTPYTYVKYRNTNGDNGATTGGTDSTAPTITFSFTDPAQIGVVFASTRNRPLTTTPGDAAYTRRAAVATGTGGSDESLTIEDFVLGSTGSDTWTAATSIAVDWSTAVVLVNPRAAGGRPAVPVIGGSPRSRKVRAYFGRRRARILRPASAPVPRPKVVVVQNADRQAHKVRARFVRHQPRIISRAPKGRPAPYFRPKIVVTPNANERSRYVRARFVRHPVRLIRPTRQPAPAPAYFRPKILVVGRAERALKVRTRFVRHPARVVRPTRATPTPTPLVRNRVVSSRNGRRAQQVRAWAQHREQARIIRPPAAAPRVYVRPKVVVTQNGDRRAHQVRSRFQRHRPSIIAPPRLAPPQPLVRNRLVLCRGARNAVKVRAWAHHRESARTVRPAYQAAVLPPPASLIIIGKYP